MTGYVSEVRRWMSDQGISCNVMAKAFGVSHNVICKVVGSLNGSDLFADEEDFESEPRYKALKREIQKLTDEEIETIKANKFLKDIPELHIKVRGWEPNQKDVYCRRRHTRYSLVDGKMVSESWLE